MELLASTLAKDHTLVLVLQDGLEKIAKSESPTSALTTFVSMVVLVRELEKTIQLVFVPWVSMASIVN
jgi:hypothetical protein